MSNFMSNSVSREPLKRRGRRASAAVTIGLSLGVLTGCDNLLEVDLPARLTDAALEDPEGAETLLNSAITHFEDSYNTQTWHLFGHTEGGEILTPAGGGTLTWYHAYTPRDFELTTVSRSFAFNIHDKLENEWTVEQVPDRAQFMAMSSIYAGAVVGWMGSLLCEITFDAGELLTPDETLAEANRWLDQALTEIAAAGGDFAMPYGIASSARTMAYGLKAQALWMKGDEQGALSAAAQVPKGFYAYVTREGGPTRRNRAYNDGSKARQLELFGVVDFWTGNPNPVTGQPWPDVIPFTGYRNLGILPDGRAVREDGLPIRTEGPYRTPIEDTAVRDMRVEHGVGPVVGLPGDTYFPLRYTSESDDIPFVNWREMWLIRAELEGGQNAIDLVNEIREEDDLPLVTYADPSNQEQIRYMIIEERRRVFYLEARFFFTKIKNTDLLWFPRNSGRTRRGGQTYGGAVRFLMPDNEYELNPNLTLNDRATGCAPAEKPVGF